MTEPTPTTAADHCEGCHDMGGNWSCDGEGGEYCTCQDCTGSEGCPECGH